jgi:hypothetical protein
MNTRRWTARPLLAASMVLGSMVGAVGLFAASPAGADTDSTTLSGQGGSFLGPVMAKLLSDDAPNLNPLFGAYASTDIDSGIAAFVGSAPGQFSADYAVTERPLTPAEADAAKANGRSFAYVPIAATPVAIATLVPTEAWATSTSPSITASDFCQHMPLTTNLLGQIFGYDAVTPLGRWDDARVDCPLGGVGKGDGLTPTLWANLDPSMANSAIMSLLDSTPTSKAYFDAGLSNPGQGGFASDTPSEKWPYSQGNSVPGGDLPLIGKLLAISTQTNAPSPLAATWKLGAIVPISSVWTGAPLGVPWNLMTGAIQNAQGAFVPPSTAAAQAALGDATVATTSDPTTNRLVTFNASATDATAYNNYLMEESYLVVPTNGLPAAKATALAQLVRYAVGPQGQQDIQSFGAAPATAPMATADLAVAAQLNAEAATSASQSTTASSTTSTTAATSTSTTAAAPAAPTAAGAGGDSTGAGGSGGSGASGSGGGLAFTGSSNLGVLVGAGTALLVAGALFRRRMRFRGVRS